MRWSRLVKSMKTKTGWTSMNQYESYLCGSPDTGYHYVNYVWNTSNTSYLEKMDKCSSKYWTLTECIIDALKGFSQLGAKAEDKVFVYEPTGVGVGCFPLVDDLRIVDVRWKPLKQCRMT